MIGWATNGFTSAEKVVEATKQGKVVQTLTLSSQANSDLLAITAKNSLGSSVSFPCISISQDNDGTLSKGKGDIVGGQSIKTSMFSKKDLESLDDYRLGNSTFCYSSFSIGQYLIKEWADESTKYDTFDTVRFNLSIKEEIVCLKQSYGNLSSGETTGKYISSSMEQLNKINSYIDISLSELVEDAATSSNTYDVYLISKNPIDVKDIGLNSIQLVNKSSSYKFVSFAAYSA